jgi:translation initiation factor 3 subunit D
MLEEIEFGRLGKLNLNVSEPEELEQHGTLQGYDKTFDRINTRTERQLEIIDRAWYNQTTSDDPIIAQLAQKDAAQVFATDAILAVLMCTTRSVNSWDIILERRGNQLFLDKRDSGPFDYVTVHENASDPPADSDDPTNVNSASSLSLEATYITRNFSSQAIDPKSKPYTPSPNPFYSEDEPAPVASCLYRYRKFDLSIGEEDKLDLVVRTEVDAYQGKKSSLVTVKALNEFDPRASGGGKALDWRKYLDTQKGAIVASEMKNNSAKLARWAVQSVLAGAETMKMG